VRSPMVENITRPPHPPLPPEKEMSMPFERHREQTGRFSALQRVKMVCSELQCDAVSSRELQCVAACCSVAGARAQRHRVLQCVVMCFSGLCCSVLQRVAVL